MRKTALLICSAAALAGMVALAGCGADKPSGTAGAPVVSTDPSPPATPSATPEQQKQMEIQIYYADDELSKLTPQSVSVSYGSDEELVAAALNALQQDGAGGEASLWKKMEWKETKLENGAVTIDLHMPDEARLGAPGEDLALRSLQQTLFQFDFVESINLLADGEEIESLMGHVELEHPFTRESAGGAS